MALLLLLQMADDYKGKIPSVRGLKQGIYSEAGSFEMKGILPISDVNECKPNLLA